ncbi:MAG: solute carrier family 26 protein [Acidobacteria bacterium]|nr:solute carrier family 26 protein [Acidobacteriota bacterium]
MSKATALPLEWLIRYKKSDLPADISAGLTIAVMLVPQGMAYAMLAGLSPVIGLYASVLPLIAYALLGSSRHLAVGPVAMISLLVFASCSAIAQPGSAEYLSIVLLLSFMVGVIQLVAGMVRLGFLINFFSHAVISGFTSAAAIIIALSQMKHLLGISLGNEQSVFVLLGDIIRHAGKTNIPTLAVGIVCIAGLCFFRIKHPHFPSAMLFVVAGTLAAYFGLSEFGLKTVGHVPRGLPPFSMPEYNLASVRALIPNALVIVFVGYMESISVAKYIAAKSGYKVDPDRELTGLGAANLVSAFFSGYPVTGGLSRTAVNHQAGARTQLAAVITAVTILLILVALTPLFYYLPNAVLGAIIVAAVSGLVDYREAIHLFRLKKADGWMFLVTFICTLTIGLEQGLLIGMVFSLILFIWKSAYPHTAELGYLESEGVFRNIKRYPQVKIFPEILILRVDASLYFANMKFLEDRIAKDLAGRPQIKEIIMDLSGVNDIDAVSIDELENLMEAYGHQGIRFSFASMKGPVRDLVTHAGWEQKYGNRINYLSIQHALRGIGQTGF